MATTRQEAAWAGAFGDAYVERNADAKLLASKHHLWGKMLARARRIDSVLELGANIGLNLVALRALLPEARLTGVEINRKAFERLSALPRVDARQGSLLDLETDERFDLTFTAGVLIHLDPAMLPRAYDQLHRLSRRYVLVAEYYNPSPVEVRYRGEDGLLYKRDFAGELLDRHADLKLVDYGFQWRRDPLFPADDLTWFLLEKHGG